MGKKVILLLVGTLQLVLVSYSQERSLQAGIKLANELTLFDGLAPGFGAQLVYRISRHGGIESGLFYQSRNISYFIDVQSGGSTTTYFTKIAERRIQIPFLYRFDAKAINFVAGPALDYIVGWKEKTKNPNVKVTSYSRNALNLVLSAGLSRSFYLTPTLILEPEAKFNFIATDDDGGLGLNISLRKKFR